MASTVYPTGTTIYQSDKCWNGYTVFQARRDRENNSGALLIDMNGNIVNRWKSLAGFPNKVLPGGYVMGSIGIRNPKYGFQDMVDLVQIDWEGNIIWELDKFEYISDPGEKSAWMVRQHHEYCLAIYTPGSRF